MTERKEWLLRLKKEEREESFQKFMLQYQVEKRK
jgi:hypothetical protein